MNRRNLFRKTILGAGSLALAPNALKAAMDTCGLTPEQTEGPFYPINDQCRPVKDALVEIWQACASGKYHHSGDPNPASLDPNFQYWGRTVTNSKGKYEFFTIIPGHCPATNSWIRPAHIHMKVHRRGYTELTTQMYFKGDSYNAGDRILQSLSQAERDSVIVDFSKKETHPLGEFNTGRFDITISSI